MATCHFLEGGLSLNVFLLAMVSIDDLLRDDEDALAKAVIDSGGAKTFLEMYVHDAVSSPIISSSAEDDSIFKAFG